MPPTRSGSDLAILLVTHIHGGLHEDGVLTNVHREVADALQRTHDKDQMEVVLTIDF